MLTFDDYKAKISIIQILEDLGYKQDISKGKISPVFKLTLIPQHYYKIFFLST